MARDFHARRPDVVFRDINMPGPSGLEVLKILRQVDDSVPVITFAFVPKPFDLEYMDHTAALATQQRTGTHPD